MYIYWLSNRVKIVADISHKDLFESLGNSAAGFTKNLANQAANFACDLYKRYPWALTFGDTGNFSKGVWDELCGRRPIGLPPAPVPPFQGGQCAILYSIYLDLIDAYDKPVTNVSGGELRGPIGGVRLVESASPNTNNGVRFKDVEVLGCGFYNEPPRPQRWTKTAYPLGSYKSITSTRLVPSSGQPDNCGNLPSSYPQTPIPPSARTTSINIDVHGTTYNIPITVQPTVNKYNINVDAGDLSFVFDLSGVTINSNPISTAINNIEGDIIDLSQDVTNLTQIVVPFINNSVNFNSSFNFGNFQTKEDSGSSSPADEEQPDNIAYVTLDITRKPVNAKTQEGELAQDLLYAGWFQFAAKGYYFPREPIHFSKAIFKAPYGATDYAYTLYEGFEAKVVIHRV